MKQKKLFVLTLAASIIFTSTGAAYASSATVAPEKNTNISSQDKKKCRELRHAERKANLEAVLKNAVDTKIITADESTKIISYYNQKASMPKNEESRKSHKEKGGFFKELVDKSIITQDKADKLKNLMHERRMQSKQEKNTQ